MERIERTTPNVVTRRYNKRTLFNRVLKELKTKEIKINYFRVCVLDEFKNRYYPDFKHNGFLYQYKWVKTCHPKFFKNAFFKSNYFYQGVDWRCVVDNFFKGNKYSDEVLSEWLIDVNYITEKKILAGIPQNDKIITYKTTKDYLFEITFLKESEKGDWKGMNQDDLTQMIQFLELKNKITKWKSFYSVTFTKKPTRFHTIRLRLKCGTMDLKKYKTPFYSPLNLKKWDKNGKTSNLGLKAIYPYKWEEDYINRSGWVFGGIKVDDLHAKCKYNLMPNYNKKMKYGELALWWYKGLE